MDKLDHLNMLTDIIFQSALDVRGRRTNYPITITLNTYIEGIQNTLVIMIRQYTDNHIINESMSQELLSLVNTFNKIDKASLNMLDTFLLNYTN